MTVTVKDIKIDMVDINSKTKQRYKAAQTTGGKYVLYNETSSREFSYPMTKKEFSYALDMLNRVLTNEGVVAQ